MDQDKTQSAPQPPAIPPTQPSQPLPPQPPANPGQAPAPNQVSNTKRVIILIIAVLLFLGGSQGIYAQINNHAIDVFATTLNVSMTLLGLALLYKYAIPSK